MHAPRPDFGEGGGDYPSGIQTIRVPEGGNHASHRCVVRHVHTDTMG